jgi:hypothetical protein
VAVVPVDPFRVTGTGGGPTRGAFENPGDRRWEASPRLATLIRVVVVASPVVGAFVGLYLVADLLYRPSGVVGLVVWFLQGLIVGTAISMSIERVARQLLPLATLFTMSLIFPDQAPSRFGVALRSGTVRRLESRIRKGETSFELGDDVGQAAVRAVEYITALARHDRLTRGHTERVRAYAEMIAAELGLSDTDREKLTWGVMLHDIGKMAVPPEILNKTDRLTDEEWTILKSHPEAGERLLTPLRDWLGPWALAASEHHERWDGGGYPRGLSGTGISLAGRITAVADAYDVITSTRSYKQPMSPNAARRELVVCSGSQFDPDVVRAFLNASLGRRWSAGILAATSHLPLANLGTAPAAVSVGAVIAAGSVVAGVPPVDTVEMLAFDDTAMIVEETTTSTELQLTGPPGTEITVPTAVEPTVTPTPAEPSTPTTTEPTTVASSEGTVTTAPTTAGRPASTTAPSTTTTTTVATTTTAVATTTAPTTTTVPTTTTTTPPSAAVFHLKNQGTGDSVSSWWAEELDPAGPDNATLPNYDTDRDDDGGLSLAPTGFGFAESNNARIHRYAMYADQRTLTGPVTLTVWAATENDLGGTPVKLRAQLADCIISCSPLDETSDNVTTWIGDGFQQMTFTFDPSDHTFAWGRYVAIRLIAEGSDTLHIAFDAAPYPSAVTMQLG